MFGKRMRSLCGFLFVTGCFSIAVLSFGGMFGARGVKPLPASAGTVSCADLPRMTVIVDAGHGGEDGGAVSASGTAEKTLNLSVAMALGDMLSACGMDVVYTRTADEGLYDGAVPGHRKMTDLKNRLAVRNAYPDAIFVSIHMNTFSDPQYHGMQLFYSDNDPSSAVLAEAVRAVNRQYLQPDNTRACKAADSSIFLLDRAAGTAILAECGFLSNPEEANRLTQAEYREQIAAVLCVGILNYAKESMEP